MRRAPSTGQALVLVALTLLLVCLLALFTLSLGVRIKERMELQTLADAAAYDNAVAEARAFNTIAVVNRTEWSLLVAQSAAQSYISWATLYRGSIDILGDKLPRAPPCAPLRQALADERGRVEQKWMKLEPQALRELQQLARVQEQLLQEDSRRQYDHLEQLVKREDVTDRVLKEARDGQHGEVSSTTKNGDNRHELEPNCLYGIACDLHGPDFERYRRNWTIMRHQHEIMQGSRGDPFTTGRVGGDRAMQKALQQALGGLASVSWTGDGSSYRSHRLFWHSDDFAEGPGNAIYPRLMPSSPMSDDHGQLSVNAPGCSATVAPLVRLRTGNELMMNEHTWREANGNAVRHCLGEHSASHQLADLGEGHAWPLIVDYNDQVPNGEQPDGMTFGQPTHQVELTRDTGQTAFDPWDLKLTLFGRLGYDTTVKGLSKAKAKAIAYYHRGGQWEEPPNFVNPFWQATLISARKENRP